MGNILSVDLGYGKYIVSIPWLWEIYCQQTLAMGNILSVDLNFSVSSVSIP
jgi:hypothetical protein